MKKIAILLFGTTFLFGCGTVKNVLGSFETNKQSSKTEPESSIKVKELRIKVIEGVASCRELLDDTVARPNYTLFKQIGIFLKPVLLQKQ
jgi:hypothetical protein